MPLSTRLLFPFSFSFSCAGLKNHFLFLQKRTCPQPVLFLLFFILILINNSCAPDKPMPPTEIVIDDKQVWVYKHQAWEGPEYTVFSTEKPINKGKLPANFLAIRHRKREHWTCLLKWEGDVLWFYTPSSRSFASHNSDNGKTQWTIIEEKDYNYFFEEDKESGYIRFSSHCGEPGVYCLDAEEMVIGQ